MWDRFNHIIEEIKTSSVPEKELKFAMTAVMLATLFGSWQRPGAMKNLTLSQFTSGVMIDGVFVVSVTDHKTGVGGVARLMFNGDLKSKVENYISYIRPKLCSDRE